MATLSNYIRHSLKNLFNYRGRASRKELLVFYLASIVFVLLSAIILILVGMTETSTGYYLKSNPPLSPYTSVALLFAESILRALGFPFAVIGILFLVLWIPVQYILKIRRINDYGYAHSMIIPYFVLSIFLINFFTQLPLAINGYTEHGQIIQSSARIMYLIYALTVCIVLEYLIWFRPGSKGRNQHGDLPKYNGTSTE